MMRAFPARWANAAMLALAAGPVFAADAAFDGGAALIRTFLGLIIVIGLILGCAWVARRFGLVARAGGNLPLKLVGSLALGPRERVVMLEVDDTWLVVGIGNGGMRTLHTLPARQLPAGSANGARTGFQQVLRQHLQKTRAGNPTTKAPPAS